MRNAALLLVTAALVAGATAGTASAIPAHSVFGLKTTADGKMVGMAALKYRARTLSGWIFVSGLTPGTTHAIHLHGPGSCAKQQASPIVAIPDITADAAGVVVIPISIPGVTGGNPLRRTSYLNIHEKSSAEGAGNGIICGDVKRRLVITI
jgi:hypothetical protein